MPRKKSIEEVFYGARKKVSARYTEEVTNSVVFESLVNKIVRQYKPHNV